MLSPTPLFGERILRNVYTLCGVRFKLQCNIILLNYSFYYCRRTVNSFKKFAFSVIQRTIQATTARRTRTRTRTVTKAVAAGVAAAAIAHAKFHARLIRSSASIDVEKTIYLLYRCCWECTRERRFPDERAHRTVHNIL